MDSDQTIKCVLWENGGVKNNHQLIKNLLATSWQGNPDISLI